ncbi:unnamed protein product [Cochlearia groenlandica]
MDLPHTFAGLNCDSVDEYVYHSNEDKMFLMEPKHDDTTAMDTTFLGYGLENIGVSTKMGELDFTYLTDYDSCSYQDREAGFKLEILDGFLDEVEDIYASSSSVADHFLQAETEVNKNVSELARGKYGLSSESSPPHDEFKNVSEGSDHKDSSDTNPNYTRLCFQKLEDDKKSLSSWTKQTKGRNKNFLNTSCTRLDSCGGTTSRLSYDFRPRKIPIHTSSESEEEVSVTTKATSKRRRRDRRKHQRIWTIEEVVKLVNGISDFGVGKWTDIKNLHFGSPSHRTAIDIRDKWRNLLKASFANNGEERPKTAARYVPKEILHRVRELASLHPYPLSKSLCLVSDDSSRSRSTSRKKKKKKKKKKRC